MENNVKANYVAHLKNGEILKMGFQCETLDYDVNYVTFSKADNTVLAVVPRENVIYIERKEKKLDEH